MNYPGEIDGPHAGPTAQNRIDILLVMTVILYMDSRS